MKPIICDLYTWQKESQKEISTIQVSLKGIANHTKGGGGGVAIYVPVGFQTEVHSAGSTCK